MSQLKRVLQKAQKLSERNKSERQSSEATSADSDAEPGSVAIQESVLNGAHKNDYESEGTSQPIVSIDRMRLQEDGLLPCANDQESIGYQFRRIKRPILNAAYRYDEITGQNANLVMLSSALPESGKTFCSINLTASIAKDRDFGAVLVDADVLKPNISRVLGLEERPGIIDYLLEPSLSLDDIFFRTDFFDVIVVPAGRKHEDATELLSSRRMGRLMSEISDRFRRRLVLVDTPPLLVTNEANVLADYMGQIVMVIEEGQTTQNTVTEALRLLDQSKPINAILNKARDSIIGGYDAADYGAYYAGHRL